MYNLLVSGCSDAWDGEPYMLALDRCVREYTDNELTVRFGNLDAENINELRRLPCIFAYESGYKKDPKFGVIRNVTIRQQKAKIEYDIIELNMFLTYTDLNEDGLAFDLDISKWEMNRTHWAVKDIHLAKELHTKGISLPSWVGRASKAVDIETHTFDVALSFPGEIRVYIESVVEELERMIGPNSYFYDNNYVSQLARPSLDTFLQKIYNERSKLIVVFLCSEYQEKVWCGVEFHAIKEIIMNRKYKKVMYIKMDDCHIESVFNTDGYIDGRKYNPSEVARFIQERVDLLRDET